MRPRYSSSIFNMASNKSFSLLSIGCKARDEGFVLEEMVSSTMQKTGFPDRRASFINDLHDSAFEYIFQPGVVPFPFIEEMSNCSTVAGAVFFKINGFPMIFKRKDGYQYSHDMLHGCLWKDPA